MISNPLFKNLSLFFKIDSLLFNHFCAPVTLSMKAFYFMFVQLDIEEVRRFLFLRYIIKDTKSVEKNRRKCFLFWNTCKKKARRAILKINISGHRCDTMHCNYKLFQVLLCISAPFSDFGYLISWLISFWLIWAKIHIKFRTDSPDKRAPFSIISSVYLSSQFHSDSS